MIGVLSYHAAQSTNLCEAEGGSADEALKKLEAGLSAQLKKLETERQEAIAAGNNAKALEKKNSGEGGESGEVLHKEKFGEVEVVSRLKEALYSQGHFEAGVDDMSSMEVNPLMLHNIIVQKKQQREAKAAASSQVAVVETATKKKRPGAPTFGNSGGLARLNLNIDKKKGGDGNLETLKSVQAFLSGQGVHGAQDKVREHCTKPGAFGANAATAASAYMEDTQYLGMMTHAARQTRQQTKPPSLIKKGRHNSTSIEAVQVEVQENHTGSSADNDPELQI